MQYGNSTSGPWGEWGLWLGGKWGGIFYWSEKSHVLSLIRKKKPGSDRTVGKGTSEARLASKAESGFCRLVDVYPTYIYGLVRRRVLARNSHSAVASDF